MNIEFYFLRSSEQKIVTDMLYYAQKLNTTTLRLEDIPHLEIYHTFYGLTPKDFGLYIMQESVVAGAIWSRRLSDYHNSNAFVDANTPVMQLAIKPEFRNKGLGKQMVQQFLQEASSLYDALSISVADTPEAKKYMEFFGFEVVPNTQHQNYTNTQEHIIMKITLEKKENKPYEMDDFSQCKWLD